ncbi:Flagellar hook protein FlgE [Pseudovibrio axinellae]|uniref:Flagellar hook protein FlgE n=1 Tax=Pseudovibrio axinellae TaxID=989403 RepID=A0A165XJ94_9HYPH|nr:flagellar hook protein FlgE [Pseudovibrio axinellae]KZL17758.1 Flagellar hook protein FlgE [Pseudovibrio axinellae]SEP73802.1 flagellar hook protein FlgE [Pseudovibrio axinellae]
MGLYGIMNTSVSGMNAQSNKLSTVADNVSNANTIGYKGYKTAFSSMVGATSMESGIVQTSVVQTVRQQGAFNFTGQGTHLAINGNGFFQVAAPDGGTYYTRAGDFVLDKNGQMVNSGGYTLLSANGSPVVVDLNTPIWEQSSQGELGVNLASSTPVTTSVPPGAPNEDYRTSVTTYDQNGNEIVIDIAFTKVAETVTGGTVDSSEWLVQAVDSGGNDISIPGYPAPGFTLTFEGNGNLDPASLTDYEFDVPNGGTVTLDLSATVTAGEKHGVNVVDVNGFGPSTIENIRVEADGRIFGIYGSGSEMLLEQIQIASFANPDGLQAKSGNIYAATDASGDPAVGYPGDNTFGELYSGAIEGSNVDLATELTEMVQAQRAYSANTKVFNASSELLQELNNLR